MIQVSRSIIFTKLLSKSLNRGFIQLHQQQEMSFQYRCISLVIQSKMQTIAFCLFLCLAMSQQTVILKSDQSVATVISPSGQTAQNEPSLNSQRPDPFWFTGEGQKWIFLKDSKQDWPIDFEATFQILFDAKCSSPGRVHVAVQDQYLFYMNGVPICRTTYDFNGNQGHWSCPVDLNNGQNNLTIKVTNKVGGRAGVAFYITQDLTQCKDDCNANALAYFDKETSKCECSIECACPSEKHWLGYPDCGCKCNQETNCQSYQYFDKKTCSCKCNSVLTCPSGQTFDHSSCSCISSCQDKCCPLDTHLDASSCDCVPDPNTI